MNARSAARRIIPFPVRAELLRWPRYFTWLVETPAIARTRSGDGARDGFQHLLARHESPLERVPGLVEPRLQHGKERNVALAASRIDGLIVRPYEIFSYHRTVGRPSRLRGFRPGLELRGERPARGIGGGCCQISNALYLVALRAGMRITERHRHGLDLFRDHERTVPFGCGATVFFNYEDLRFENPLPQPVLLQLRIGARALIVEMRAPHDPGWRVEVYETEHRYFRLGKERMRENRIRRRFVLPDGSTLLDQEVAHNRGRVVYEQEEARCGARS